MNRILCWATAATLCYAGSASALTMTPLTDNRSTQANAMAGQDSDSQTDVPDAGFPTFVSESSAVASEFGVEDLLAVDGGIFGNGAHAEANARQSSGLGPLSISGSGAAAASGDHGSPVFASVVGDAGYGLGTFSAYAESVLEIAFSIDEDAAFDLNGFLRAGDELAVGPLGNDVINSASVLLADFNTKESVFKVEISDDDQIVDESGILEAGNYVFRVTAYAEVFGGAFMQAKVLGDLGGEPFGYATRASFEKFSLNLSEIDKPIPEPVTTSLIGMGLGALMLGTSRRRA